MTELIQLAKQSTVVENLEFEDYVYLYNSAREQSNNWQWAAAQIAHSVQRKYGEQSEYKKHSIQEFAAEVDVSSSYIYQLAKTWEVFGEIYTRVENLSFSHHKAAANLAESAGEAQAFLRQIPERTSVRDLETAILQATGREREMRLVPVDRETQKVLDEQKAVNPYMSDSQAIREIALKNTGKITCRLEGTPELKGAICVISEYLLDGSFENCVEFALKETARRIQEKD